MYTLLVRPNRRELLLARDLINRRYGEPRDNILLERKGPSDWALVCVECKPCLAESLALAYEAMRLWQEAHQCYGP